MKPPELAAYLHARPFKPFEIHLTDGRSFVLDHPDFLMFSRDRDTVTIALDPDEENNFQTRETIDVAHIVSVSEDSKRRPSRRQRRSA